MTNCSKCDIELTNENKTSGKNICKVCMNKINRERVNNKKLELINKLCEKCKNKSMKDCCQECNKFFMKTCNSCNIEKAINKFISIKHNKCKECSVPSKKITKEEWINQNKHITNKICIKCNVTKPLDRFSFRETNFRNECKDCINNKKLYKNYREKKRNEDEEAYIKHNTEVHRKWIEKNKEKHTAKYRFYSKTFNRVVSNILNKIKQRHSLENEETIIEMIKNLIVQPCIYCNKEAIIDDIENNIKGDYLGIDRIDSTKEYTLDNCVSCCSTCNMIKKTMDTGSFLRKSCEIYNNTTTNSKISIDDYRFQFHKEKELIDSSGNYYTYISTSKRKNNLFLITKEQFNNIIKNKCYLCNKTNKEQKIGIDRYDNNIEYTLDNCRPCCNYCNYIKKEYSYDFLVNHIQKIVKHTDNNPLFMNKTYKFSGVFVKTKNSII